MLRFFKNRGFRKELERALADGVLTDDEVKYLEERSDELEIEQEFVNKIMREHSRRECCTLRTRE
jgi:hypothetical protein